MKQHDDADGEKFWEHDPAWRILLGEEGRNGLEVRAEARVGSGDELASGSTVEVIVACVLPARV